MTSDFLFTDDFISTANKNFDTLLLEKDFSEQNDFLWAVAYHTRQEKKLLIVLSQTSVDSIFPMIQLGKAITLLINPSCWLPWFANKWFWDIRDITKARDFWLHVIEPIYQEQVIALLSSLTSSSYLRINEHISWKEQLPEIHEDNHGFFHFQQQWYSGTSWTILCFWSLLVDTLYWAWYLLEEGQSMDLFVTTTPFFTLQGAFKESLQKTERLIIILDQHLWSLYDTWLLGILYKSGLSNISLTFITPYYQHISSLSLEYMYEQAEIDGFHIAKRIKD